VPSAAQSESHAPREVRRAVSSLRRARLLSVDKAPLLNEGLLLFAAGRREAAIAITERLVAEEPANIEAWLALYTLYSVSGDTKRAGEAARRARALNPLVGDRLHDARP
jgi:DNA-binding SARP family transcriptional activator